MSKTKTREQIIRMIFAQHQTVETFYFTSDNQAFAQSHDAKLHAANLEDKKVEEVSRKDASDQKINDADENAGAAVISINTATEKASLIDRYKGTTGHEPAEGMTEAEMEAEIATIEAERQAGLDKGTPVKDVTEAKPAKQTSVAPPAKQTAAAKTGKGTKPAVEGK